MGGRDHSCEVCGRGGFNDPDGECVCEPAPDPFTDADRARLEKAIHEWDLEPIGCIEDEIRRALDRITHLEGALEDARVDIHKRGIMDCIDCGWVGNRPEVSENHQEGWEEPCTRYFCPECGEPIADYDLASTRAYASLPTSKED